MFQRVFGSLAVFGFIFFASLAIAADIPAEWTIYESFQPRGSKRTYYFVLEAEADADQGLWYLEKGNFRKIRQGPVDLFPNYDELFAFEDYFNIPPNFGFHIMTVGAGDKSFGLATVTHKDGTGTLFVLRGNNYSRIDIPHDGRGYAILANFIQAGPYHILTIDNGPSGNTLKVRVIALHGETGEIKDLGDGRMRSGIDYEFTLKGQKSTKQNLIKWLGLKPDAEVSFEKGGQDQTDTTDYFSAQSIQRDPYHDRLKEEEEVERGSEIDPDGPLGGLEDVEVESAGGGRASALDVIKPWVEDLTYKYKEEPLDHIKVDEEFKRQVRRGLLKIERGSVVVLGPAGSGKSTSVKSIVSEIVNDETLPEELRGYRFIRLDLMGLAGGTMYAGTFETKINAINALSRANKIIWVGEEFHNMRGMGTHMSNANDALEMLKPGMADGTIRFLMDSTVDDFALLEGDSAITERMSIVMKDPLKGDELRAALTNWATRAGLKPPPPDVLEEIIRISTEMNPVGAQPRKSVTLMEEIYADMRERGQGDKAPTMEDVRKMAVDLYGMDPAMLDPKLNDKRLKDLVTYMNEEIVGQNEVKQAIFDSTRQVFAELHDKSRPRIMAVLAGGKGRGKTAFAMAYAKGLGLPFHVIELNSFDSARGYDRASLMEEIYMALQKNAFTVLIFDELEKAPISIQNELLRMFGNGEFSVSVKAKGTGSRNVVKLVNARNSTVFLTTNAGTRPQGVGMGFAIGGNGVSTEDDDLRTAMVEDGVSEYLLDRLYLALAFKDQSKDDFKLILDNHFGRALKAAELSLGVKILVEGRADFLDFMADKYFRPDMSNREVQRILLDMRNALAKEFYTKKPQDAIVLDFANGEFQVQTAKRALTPSKSAGTCESGLTPEKEVKPKKKPAKKPVKKDSKD